MGVTQARATALDLGLKGLPLTFSPPVVGILAFLYLTVLTCENSILTHY